MCTFYLKYSGTQVFEVTWSQFANECVLVLKVASVFVQSSLFSLEQSYF